MLLAGVFIDPGGHWGAVHRGRLGVAHHDVELVDDQGRVLARRRLPEGIAGITALYALVADHLGDDDEPDQVLVGIETDRDPWVEALIAAGHRFYSRCGWSPTGERRSDVVGGVTVHDVRYQFRTAQ
jgi:hypothetical protein